jgi:hypothetical protein
MHDQVKGSRLKTKLLLVALLVVAGCAAVVLYRKVTFPYGHRAAVLRSMYFALLNYASEHDGRFPTSEKGNYDALQKLYPEYAPSGIELAGISGNVDAVVAALRNKAPLDQSLTSWVYMQGFTKDDDAGLAVLWESREGLYPNGKRNSFGGHAVLLIGGDITNVPAADWESFLKQQEQLRNAVQIKRAAGTNAPSQPAP